MIKKYVAALFLLLGLSLGLIGFEGCGSKPSVPETADGTVIAVVEALKKGNPEIVWAALPISYQNDINGLVHEFAGKMDLEIWDKIFEVGRKVINVAKIKKEFILANPLLFSGYRYDSEMIEELNKNWDSIVAIIEGVVNSEIAKLDNLKTLNVGNFLEGTGKEIMKQLIAIKVLIPDNPIDELKNVSASYISGTDYTAKVTIIVQGEKPEEVDFIKVKGRWVPKKMAYDWANNMQEVRETIAEIEHIQNKHQILAGITMIDSFLDQLSNIKTQQKFDQVVEEYFVRILPK